MHVRFYVTPGQRAVVVMVQDGEATKSIAVASTETLGGWAAQNLASYYHPDGVDGGIDGVSIDDIVSG